GAALGVALLGAVVERLFFRTLYGREELYQLLFIYALVLILGDAAKFLWGVGQLSGSGVWCAPPRWTARCSMRSAAMSGRSTPACSSSARSSPGCRGRW